MTAKEKVLEKKNKFIVYFKQINQQAIKVEANNPDEALLEARKIWMRHVYPDYEIQKVKQ